MTTLTQQTLEVAITKEFSGATPVWDTAVIYVVTPGTASFNFPALGSTKYAVRYRVQDVYGQFSEWSASTEHTTVAGSDSLQTDTALTSEFATQAEFVENTPATVVIDEDGITITDGALTIEDEFGATSMTASGFDGSWADFINLGLYNARLLAGVVGTIPTGRTVALPYWTVNNLEGTPTKTFESGGGFKVKFSAHTTSAQFVSDPIAYAGRGGLEFGFRLNYRMDGAQNLRARAYYQVADEPTFASASDSTQRDALIVSPGTVAGNVYRGFDTIRGKYIRLVIELREMPASHDADNYLMITEAWLKNGPTLFDFATLGSEDAPAMVMDSGSDPQIRFFEDVSFEDTADLLNVHKIELVSSTDASLSSTEHALQIGSTSGINLIADPNEIQARNNGAASTLNLNIDGGKVQSEGAVNDTYTVSGEGSATSTKRLDWMRLGQLVVFHFSFVVTANGSGASTVTFATPLPAPLSGPTMFIMSRGGAGVRPISIRMDSNGDFDQMRAIDGNTIITGADLANGASYICSGAYLVA